MPPSLAVSILFLRAYERVSFVEAIERTTFDLRWKVALGLEMEEVPMQKSALQELEAKLVLTIGTLAGSRGLTEAFLKTTTVGGIICQLRVVRVDGAPLRFVDALVRGLSSMFSLAVLGLGCLWILKDPERQAWHDRIAGTYVVQVPRNWAL